MEQIGDRMEAVEDALKKLGPVEALKERLALMEHSIYSTKSVFTFLEACQYLGVSESLLYKLTSTKEIPHYKPRGKMLYFSKEELDNWLLQNRVEPLDPTDGQQEEANEVKPYFGQRRYAGRKKH